MNVHFCTLFNSIELILYIECMIFMFRISVRFAEAYFTIGQVFIRLNQIQRFLASSFTRSFISPFISF